MKQQPNPNEQRYEPGDAAAFAKVTNIDRRQCTRKVPMRVLALGFSRTGTCSLRQALIDLGYNDCYHFSAPLQENPRDAEMWVEAFEAKFEGKGQAFTRKDWDQLLGHCQAVTDAPCYLFAKELMEAYPDAKIILTERDNVDQWFKSCMTTIIPYFEEFCRMDVNLFTRIYRWFLPISSASYKFTDLLFRNSPIFRALVTDYRNGTENAKQLYKDYNEHIKSTVPKEKLLVMNVKEGWKPLCDFLGEEEPSYAFPRKNDTITFNQLNSTTGVILDQIAKWNMFKTVGLMSILGLATAVGAQRYGLLQSSRMFRGWIHR